MEHLNIAPLRRKNMRHVHILTFLTLVMDWTTQKHEANIHFVHKTSLLWLESGHFILGIMGVAYFRCSSHQMQVVTASRVTGSSCGDSKLLL